MPYLIHHPQRGWHQTGTGWVGSPERATVYKSKSNAEKVILFQRAFSAQIIHIDSDTEAACKAAAQEEARNA